MRKVRISARRTKFVEALPGGRSRKKMDVLRNCACSLIQHVPQSEGGKHAYCTRRSTARHTRRSTARADTAPLETFCKIDFFSTQKCECGLKCQLQNCIFRRRSMILASKAFFKIAFFDAKMRLCPEKPFSKLHSSTQKCDCELKRCLQNCVFRRKHAIVASKSNYSKLHSSTQKCDLASKTF